MYTIYDVSAALLTGEVQYSLPVPFEAFAFDRLRRCRQGVDIPGTFRCYNAMYIDSKSQGRYEYAQTVGLTRDAAFATKCIGCGKCEKHCPQSIPIREKLKEADKALRPLPYKIAIGIVRKFMFRK